MKLNLHFIRGFSFLHLAVLALALPAQARREVPTDFKKEIACAEAGMNPATKEYMDLMTVPVQDGFLALGHSPASFCKYPAKMDNPFRYHLKASISEDVDGNKSSSGVVQITGHGNMDFNPTDYKSLDCTQISASNHYKIAKLAYAKAIRTSEEYGVTHWTQNVEDRTAASCKDFPLNPTKKVSVPAAGGQEEESTSPRKNKAGMAQDQN